MKKIGLITIHNCSNYGACYQSYALYKYLQLQGCDIELIDLALPSAKDYKDSRIIKSKKSYGPPIIIKIKRFIKRFITGKWASPSIYYEDMRTYEAYQHFYSLIDKRTPHYSGPDELYANPPIYDLYITGSDQVWNPIMGKPLEPYFLTFAPTTAQKISYGASIGINTIPDTYKSKFKDWLSTYTSISVREREAKEELERITQREIIQVMDPTFLLSRDQWLDIAFPIEVEKPYILMFSLGMNIAMIEFSRRMSKESGLPLIIICESKDKEEIKKLSMMPEVKWVGPQQLINYIAKAEIVFTQSFHGTAMSIILKTNNFFTYISPNNNRSSRIRSLMEILNINNHILDGTLNFHYNELIKRELNFNDIQKHVNTACNLSKSYLNKYIQNFKIDD